MYEMELSVSDVTPRVRTQMVNTRTRS